MEKSGRGIAITMLRISYLAATSRAALRPSYQARLPTWGRAANRCEQFHVKTVASSLRGKSARKRTAANQSRKSPETYREFRPLQEAQAKAGQLSRRELDILDQLEGLKGSNGSLEQLMGLLSHCQSKDDINVLSAVILKLLQARHEAERPPVPKGELAPTNVMRPILSLFEPRPDLLLQLLRPHLYYQNATASLVSGAMHEGYQNQVLTWPHVEAIESVGETESQTIRTSILRSIVWAQLRQHRSTADPAINALYDTWEKWHKNGVELHPSTIPIVCTDIVNRMKRHRLAPGADAFANTSPELFDRLCATHFEHSQRDLFSWQTAIFALIHPGRRDEKPAVEYLRSMAGKLDSNGFAMLDPDIVAKLRVGWAPGFHKKFRKLVKKTLSICHERGNHEDAAFVEKTFPTYLRALRNDQSKPDN